MSTAVALVGSFLLLVTGVIAGGVAVGAVKDQRHPDVGFGVVMGMVGLACLVAGTVIGAHAIGGLG